MSSSVVWTATALPSGYMTSHTYTGKLNPLLVLQALEMILTIRGGAPKHYVSPFHDIDFIALPRELADDIRDISKKCACIRGVSRYFHEIGTKAMYKVMMSAKLPQKNLFMEHSPRVLLYNFQNRFTASLVRRFELFYEDLQPHDAMLGSLCLVHCTQLEEVHIRVLKGDEDDIRDLISGVPVECKATLWRFECHLPRECSHIPFYYLKDMLQLRILTAAYSGSMYGEDPRPEDYPALDKEEFPPPMRLEHLTKLRVHRADLLEPMVLWPTPNLEALRVDYELEHNVSLTVGAFLYVNGNSLKHLDIRYIAEKRDDLFYNVPNLKEAVFDVRGEMWITPEWEMEFHRNLETLALKACFKRGLVTVIRWPHIVMYLNFFTKISRFPALRQIWLMDLSRTYFRLMPWNPFEARQWFKVLDTFMERNVEITDCDKELVSRHELDALESHALGIRRAGIDSDSEEEDADTDSDSEEED